MYDVSLWLDTVSSSCPTLVARVNTVSAAQSLNNTMRGEIIRTFNPMVTPVDFTAIENNGAEVPVDFLRVPVYDGTPSSILSLDVEGFFDRSQKTIEMILACSERYPITVDPSIDAVSRARLSALYYNYPGLAWVTTMEAGIITPDEVHAMCTTAGVPKVWY